MEPARVELAIYCLQSNCSPNWAMTPIKQMCLWENSCMLSHVMGTWTPFTNFFKKSFYPITFSPSTCLISADGFEPSSQGSKPCGLPSFPTHRKFRATGFEPALFTDPNRVPYQTRRRSVFIRDSWIWTNVFWSPRPAD